MGPADVEALYATESRHVLATLIRLLGDLDVAEDALHEAFLAAAEQWPREGVPRNPRSWLISTGRFRAIDAIRRRARYDAALPRLAAETARSEEMSADTEHISDDDLRLIFLCCHPDLSLDAQIALTLREACGLTTEEIAAAFLATPSTIAQRIVRAKAKLRGAGIAYEIPARDEFARRLRGVLRVIYLLFSEGYDASSGEQLIRADLCQEALRLARLVAGLLPDGETRGLLALMLFHQARRRARVSAAGDLILLEEQDRSAWDRGLIAEAKSTVASAMTHGRMGPYACQAAIAQVHTDARHASETNWERIVQLYDALLAIEPTPIVELNRAAAVAMRDGPEAGLALLDALEERGELRAYRFTHATRADLYRRLGRTQEARAAYETALQLTEQQAERRFLLARLSSL